MRPIVLTLALLAACSGPVGWPDSTPDAITTYAEIVRATYEDTVDEATALQADVNAFVAAPDAGGLDVARATWRASREPYLQSEVFRFYDGPIDNAADGPEGEINAWPLDENYIDYVEGDEDAGLVNDPSVTLDESAIAAANLQGGEKNVASGYHAVEFLLWGQDHSDTGPGDRPWTDYATDGSATVGNPERRAAYLTSATQMLVDDLARVRDAWATDAEYRVAFEADPEASFGDVLTGMIILSGFETGGERLQAAFDSGSQEDEHSCFSDNTHRDMIQDVQGILNVWTGKYVRTDGSTVQGTSIRDVVAEVDADLADTLDERIQESLDLANALQPPFDQEIKPGSDGNARVQALIASLHQQESVLFDVFDALGLTVEIPE